MNTPDSVARILKQLSNEAVLLTKQKERLQEEIDRVEHRLTELTGAFKAIADITQLINEENKDES